MPIGATVAVATTASAAIGASAQSKAAKKSANAISDASDQATALQRETYYDQRGLLAPSITAGAQARARQMLMQGIPAEQVKQYLMSTAAAVNQPAPGGPSATPQTTPRRFMGLDTSFLNSEGQWEQGGGQTIEAVPGEDYSWVDNYEWAPSSPSYQWRFDEGQRATERSHAAGGDFFSGDTMIALQDRGQNAASQEFEADWARFGDLAGDGEQATGTTVNVAGQYGDSAAANARTAGQARASGYQQAGNAWAGFWNDAVPGAIGAGYGYGAKNGWI